MLEKLAERQGVQRTRNQLSRERKHSCLALRGWSAKSWAATHALLAKYHDIFSLKPGELGCTHMMKHKIKVIDDGPFKERFWRIPPPMVDEVCAYMKEMLQVGTIHPSQSLWYNAVVLVCKKDGSLCFCINFHELMQEPRRTPTPSHRYRKHWRA